MNEIEDGINGANRFWYVVRTKTGDEHRANRNLLNQEIETFLPLFRDYCYHNGKMIPKIKPLFPNYLFANFNLESLYYKVKWTRGVGLILGNREGPIPISAKVVQAILDRIGRDNLVELEDQIKTGDFVQVTSGPLKDLIGIFERRMSGKDRVTILLNLIGVDVPVQISKYQIRKVA
jgi:transcription elongation factor/antiterminator RfaH